MVSIQVFVDKVSRLGDSSSGLIGKPAIDDIFFTVEESGTVFSMLRVYGMVDNVSPILPQRESGLTVSVGIVARQYGFIGRYDLVSCIREVSAKIDVQITGDVCIIVQGDFVSLVLYLAHIHSRQLRGCKSGDGRDGIPLDKNVATVFDKVIESQVQVIEKRQIDGIVLLPRYFPMDVLVPYHPFVNFASVP